jgi:hypothetical protein
MLKRIIDRWRDERALRNALSALALAAVALAIDAFLIAEDVLRDHPQWAGVATVLGFLVQAWKTRQEVSPVPEDQRGQVLPFRPLRGKRPARRRAA